MRILHVEDDDDTRKLVECILQGEGWQVVSVENATSAFKLAATGGFDLYLIDNWGWLLQALTDSSDIRSTSSAITDNATRKNSERPSTVPR